MKHWDESVRERAAKTAIESPQVWGLVLGAIVISIAVSVLFLSGDEDKFGLLYLRIGFGISFFLLFLSFFQYKLMRYMITHGVHVLARVGTITCIAGKSARLTLLYDHGGSVMKKSINVHPGVAWDFEDQGGCEILVDPKKPKRIMLVANI